MSFVKILVAINMIFLIGSIAFGAWCGYPSLGPYVFICALAEVAGFGSGGHGLVYLGSDQEFAVGLIIWVFTSTVISALAGKFVRRRDPFVSQ